ncbi:MAG: UDP-N-acetylglucosamine 1-carboxyvinyltransferase [Candidatus Portnoybacteria bacterium CG03_land_8_20_14_0_80_41_10]|uniref:UDP-N-acetylglucosamine 1-carboxyvinyltransferase n=1 Tax=Candidatus Portnoybacteria bacterium CG03_land_8_20_14_0_80_41_10 TaxID=1974808 RepID=A0A2M7BUH9_9BACT|nr:MAG: UDP-N-acetylglucosamine 1-carboxyvinyltransferase [Candidatus Portnoybacteria bacterium CG03_land_8_20_14_0_80_41_10]
MAKFVIRGGRKLKGTIRVKGAKNAALKLLAASLLTDQEWIIGNVPQIEDIFRLIELLKGVGAEVENKSDGLYHIRAKNITEFRLEPDIAQKLKGSILMAAPLLVRRGQAVFPRPGGCVIGQRPRDIFLTGFEAFGVRVKENDSGYQLTIKKQLKGTKFVFPLISVTATETMLLMAVLAKGKTLLKNAACEPEIVALADFLNQCGAKINGAGTPFIGIEGVSSLKGGRCQVMPDRIEAGSFIILGAASQSPIKVVGLNPENLDVFWFLLERAGVNFKIGRDSALIKPGFKLKAVNLKTHEYPGLATDLQAPFTVLMTQAQGLSLIHETIFEGRLFYTDLLNQMGANIIMADPHRVIVQGPTELTGRCLISPDIRAGIDLIIAALIARGQSVIENIYQIDRGYEKIEERMQKLGADIQRVD